MDPVRNSEPPAAPTAPEADKTIDGLLRSDVRHAPSRVLRSRTMATSEKLIRFLSFVVETKLNGEEHYLKETTIGVSVFGRSPDYDPKTDTIVRSQAWRLRAKLKE